MENIENIANKSKYELLNENFLTLFNDNISYKNANDLREKQNVGANQTAEFQKV